MRAYFSYGVLAVALVACGSSNPPGFAGTDAGGGGGDNGGGSSSGGSSGGSGSGSDSGPILGVSDAAPPPTGPTLLYAHDNTTLYQIDPTDPTLAATSLGAFDCIGGSGASSMTDIALDDAQNLFGVATDTIFLDMKIATGGVTCAKGAVKINAGGVSAGNARFYGQSFAPKGTLDAAAETLVVGNNQGEMYAVNPQSGALTIVGTFGTVPSSDGNGNTYPSDTAKYGGAPGSVFQMSGDIVFLDNGGTPLGFATVRDCASASSCSKVDTLVELDLSKMKAGNTGSVVKSVRGQIRKAATCTDANNTSYGSMYGIAAYQSKIIGFSHQGFIVSIDNADGTACLIHDYSGTIAFDGAGVTTKAPVQAPPPK